MNQKTTAAPAVPVARSEPLGPAFLDFIAQGELRVAVCRSTGSVLSYAARCVPGDVEWKKASGSATLRSFTLMRNSPDPGKKVPYNVAWVELQEGPRMISTVEVADEGQLECGMQLSARFNDQGKLVFTPAKG